MNYLLKTLLIIIFIMSLNCSTTNAQTKGKAKFDHTTYNFGRITEGKKVIHIYKFKNVGNEDLVIKNVLPSCGCTAVLISNEIIEPGKTGEIKLDFNTYGRAGSTRKTVLVIFNSEINSEIELELVGIIMPIFDIQPDYVDFGYIKNRKNKEIKIEISANPNINEDIEITSIIPIDDYVIVKYKKVKDLRNCYNIYLKIDYDKLLIKAKKSGAFQDPYSESPKTQASFYGWIKIITTYEERENFTVRYSGMLKNPNIKN